MINEQLFLISYLFNFCTCLFTSENFGFEKKISDMLQTLQRDQVQKEYSDIVYNLSLHHVGEFEACQTGSNIFTFFLSPSRHLGPKILRLLSIVSPHLNSLHATTSQFSHRQEKNICLCRVRKIQAFNYLILSKFSVKNE